MLQEIAVFVILSISVLFVTYNFIKKIRAGKAKKTSGCNSCSGCSGCEVSKIEIKKTY